MTPTWIQSIRDVGGIAAIQRLLPDWSVPVVFLVTQLGDAWFLLLSLSLVYWFHSRREGAFALGGIVGALAATVALKAVFALPRPPPTTQLVATGGFGFPSGHAIAVVVGWGLVAALLDVGSRRNRAAVAVVAMGLVGLSRVALGVHYAVDVIVGFAVGGLYLAGVLVWGRRDPVRSFGLAVAVAAIAVAATGVGPDAVLLLGAAAGGLIAFLATDAPPEPWRREGVGPALVTSVAAGGLLAFGYQSDFGALVELFVGMVAFAGVIAAPAIVERARD